VRRPGEWLGVVFFREHIFFCARSRAGRHWLVPALADAGGGACAPNQGLRAQLFLYSNFKNKLHHVRPCGETRPGQGSIARALWRRFAFPLVAGARTVGGFPRPPAKKKPKKKQKKKTRSSFPLLGQKIIRARRRVRDPGRHEKRCKTARGAAAESWHAPDFSMVE